MNSGNNKKISETFMNFCEKVTAEIEARNIAREKI